jgi:hypothetical protein
VISFWLYVVQYIYPYVVKSFITYTSLLLPVFAWSSSVCVRMPFCRMNKQISRELLANLKVMSSIPTRETFYIEIYQWLLKGWWFNSRQDNFNYFLTLMYK